MFTERMDSALRSGMRKSAYIPTRLAAALALWVVGTFALPAEGGEPAPAGAGDVSSVFYIAKSQNRNQVHYGVHLDGACHPLGPEPVFAYWLMREQGGRMEPLLSHELAAYGLSEGQSIENGQDLTRIHVRLRAFPDRPLVLTVRPASGRCDVRATTQIADSEAQLDSIYVKLRFPFSVDYILLRGFRLSDNQWIEETLRR
jgi:hypothetical protein